jgi:hypothetical protein
MEKEWRYIMDWPEMKRICELCPKSTEDDLPYLIWWSYCQKHCKFLRSIESGQKVIPLTESKEMK